uniref:Putative secreted protein n=1 Tax=Corethrella appendiculata TaxID=1370023 RepID=U5ES22_9DIPT
MASTMKSIIIASVFLVIFIVDKGSAIKCFECNSHNDTKCADDIPPDSLSVECGDHKHGVTYTFCRKITQVIEFSVNSLPPDSRVIRGCGWDDSNYKGKCYQRSGFGGRQEVCACYEDNCNSASTASIALGLILSTLLAIMLRV